MERYSSSTNWVLYILFNLFDRYLKKKKVLKLFLSAAAFAFIGSIITELVIYVAFHNQGVNWGGNDIVIIGLLFAFVSLINGVTGLVVKGFINWYNDIKFKGRTYQEKL